MARGKKDYESSLRWHNKSLGIKMRTLKPDDLSIAKNPISIGNVYGEIKDYAYALESYTDKALTIYKKALWEDHPDVTMCMCNMSVVSRRQNKYSEALELYQKTLSIREKHLPINHFDYRLFSPEYWWYSSLVR